MLSIIDSNTGALLNLAIDAVAMRQQAIAHNIANANTPGYQRISVNFESRLGALRDAGGQVAAPSLASLAGYRPTFEYAGAEQKVQLDVEMAELSETTLRHQTLLKALNKQIALLGMAISEGKR